MCCAEVFCLFPRPSRLIRVGELFDRKDALFFIVLHLAWLDTCEQTQVVFFLSSGLTQISKLARGAMFIQNKGWWLRR